MNNKGFTLVESLIVLAIVTIVSSSSLFLFRHPQLIFESKLFISQLQSDLYVAQQYAIAHQSEITVSFFPDQKYYYVRDRYDAPLLIERYYSSSINIQMGSLPLSFKFLPNGSTNQIGTLFIQINEKFYKLTLQLGKGRFYIVEA